MRISFLVVMLIITAVLWPAIVDLGKVTPPAGFEPFFDLISGDPVIAKRAESIIEAGWDDSQAVLLLEVARVDGSLKFRPRIRNLLARATGQSHEWDAEDCWQWIWSEDPGIPPRYADFKAVVYSAVDPRFHEYFDDNHSSRRDPMG